MIEVKNHNKHAVVVKAHIDESKVRIVGPVDDVVLGAAS